MPYTHDPIFPHRKDTHPSVQACLYRASSSRPKFVPITTQDNGLRHFAFLHGVIEGAKLQPYIHVAEVNVIHRGRPHPFYFFFKNHCRLPENQTVRTMTSDISWRGDVIIMRGSHGKNGVVNMRQNDAKLADFALKKCVRKITQGRRVRIPRCLTFTK